MMRCEHRKFALRALEQTLVLSLVLVAASIAACGVRGSVKIPFVHGPVNLNGADYTSTYTTLQSVPIMFKMDGKRNVFAAQRGRIQSLDKNVTIFYFKPRQLKITESSLNAQVADIWLHYKDELPKGDLDLLILRCMPHNPTMITYSYMYAKGKSGKWSRLRDEDYLDRIIGSQV